MADQPTSNQGPQPIEVKQGQPQQRTDEGTTPVTPRRRESGEFLPTTVGFNAMAKRMRDEFDRLIDDFFGGRSLFRRGNEQWGWGIDVDDRDDMLVIRAEAPGFEPDEFDLQVRGDQLVLRAKHKEDSEDRERGVRQWGRQEMVQTFPLPPGIDKDRVEAQYRNGVLKITLPKTEEGRGRRINIKT